MRAPVAVVSLALASVTLVAQPRLTLDHAAIARRLVQQLALKPGERVMSIAMPGLFADLVPHIRYEVMRAGGIDLLILGLGVNGHIGFNEPAAALAATTHRVRLTPATRRANAALFHNRRRDVPREGLSMGMGTILRARRIVMLSTGLGKARCVEQMLKGPVTTRVPASFLQLHAHAEVWLDRAAASRL